MKGLMMKTNLSVHLLVAELKGEERIRLVVGIARVEAAAGEHVDADDVFGRRLHALEHILYRRWQPCTTSDTHDALQRRDLARPFLDPRLCREHDEQSKPARV